MPILTSTQLASRVAVNAQLTQLQAEAAVKAIGPALAQFLSHGHAVDVEGLGLVKVKQREDGTNAVYVQQTRKVREVLNG